MKQIFVIISLIFICRYSYSQNWISIYQSNEEEISIDVDNVEVKEGFFYYIWVKVAYPLSSTYLRDEIEKNIKRDSRYLHEQSEIKKVKEKWNNLSHTVLLFVINIQNKKKAIEYIIDYDKSGKVLNSESTDNLEFSRIIPGSIGSHYLEACKNKWIFYAPSVDPAVEFKKHAVSIQDINLFLRKNPKAFFLKIMEY